MATTSSVPYARERDVEPVRTRGFLDRFVATNNSAAQLVARLALGIVMFPHGAQKMLGWFGGHGWSGTLGFFASMGIPTWLGALVIFAEFFGSIALILGVCTRLAALGIAAVMVGSIVKVHAKMGFFADWGGTMQGEGYEYHLLALGLALALVIAGAGAASIDRALYRRRTV